MWDPLGKLGFGLEFKYSLGIILGQTFDDIFSIVADFWLLNLDSWLNFQLFKEVTILSCEFIFPLLISRCRRCDRLGL